MVGWPGGLLEQTFTGDAATAFQPDSEAGWANRAGVYTVTAPSGLPMRYTNWTEGRRATSEAEPAPDHARPRTIILGDADAYGAGLPDAATFAWRVQQARPEAQVDNYGTPGYGSWQSFVRMGRALEKAPAGAAVYYVFNGSHEARNVADPAWIRVDHHPGNGVFFPYATLYNGALEAQASPGNAIWPLSRTFRTEAMLEQFYEKTGAFPRVYRKRAVTQAILIRMHHLALLSGAKFTVILFDLDPTDRQPYRNFLSSRNIAFLDCDSPELHDQSLRQPDGSPNAKLNALLAGWIEGWIEADSASARASGEAE